MDTTVKEKPIRLGELQDHTRELANKGIVSEGTCSTAAETAAKTVTLGTTFKFESGATFLVKFTNAVSVASSTLAVTHTDLDGVTTTETAKPIYYRGAALPANKVSAGDNLILRYDGTSYNVIGTLAQDFTETDPVFSASAAAGITSDDIDNWNSKTSNVGTITGITMNGSSKGTSGVVDLGTVITSHQDISGKADASDLSSHTGNNDIHVTLQDKSNWSGKQDALVFNTTYDATTNKAATMADVPDAQIQSDWNQTTTTAKDYIKNKPNLATVATSGSYNDLSNKPTIPTIEDFHEAVATLSATPTSSTLTYTRDGVTYEYKIGDQVRVHDTEKGTAEGNYYVFYTLKDKSNNTAYWEESGSGGGTSMNTYSVLIDSNQTDKTDIANARVTYNNTDYGNGASIYVSHSTAITPSDLSVTAITGYSVDILVSGWVIIVTYSTEILTVTITADETPANVSACTVTVTNGNTTLGTLTNGQSLKIPYGVNYVCTPSSAPSGYTAPSAVTKDWSDSVSKALTFTYICDYVDLGLPSGVKWAKGNICKDSNGNYYMGEPTEYGSYFSYGNTDGHITGDGYSFDQTTYNSTPGAALTASYTSGDATYDAARVRLGGSWRIPTVDETDELISNTDIENATINGINGRKFMKKTDHSVFIFIPNAGYTDTTINALGQTIVCATSRLATKGFCYTLVLDGTHTTGQWNGVGRSTGVSIRPVL